MPSGFPPPDAGRLIAGRYVLLNVLARGGAGQVWLAHDQVLDSEVAIKEIGFPGPGRADREHAVRIARARADARHAAVLRGHPHVVTVHDVLEFEDRPWIVMEYLHGAIDLRALVAQRGPVAPAECARIGLAVLDALTAGHEQGIMHRDVKPATVLLAPDRTGSPYARVLLSDYGISVPPDSNTTRYTSPAALIGTSGYIAPERIEGGAPTAAADLFSLGCTLYYGVEGHGPFERESELASITAVVTEEPHPFRRAGALEPVLRALLVKDPAQRITAASAESMLSAVQGTGPYTSPAKDGSRGPTAVPRFTPASVSAPPAAPPGPGLRAAAGSTLWSQIVARIVGASAHSGSSAGAEEAESGLEAPPAETDSSSLIEADAVAGASASSINHALARLFLRLGPPPQAADDDRTPVSSGGGGAQQ